MCVYIHCSSETRSHSNIFVILFLCTNNLIYKCEFNLFYILLYANIVTFYMIIYIWNTVYTYIIYRIFYKHSIETIMPSSIYMRYVDI